MFWSKIKSCSALYKFITDLPISFMYSYNNFTFMIEKTSFHEFVTLAVYQKRFYCLFYYAWISISALN